MGDIGEAISGAVSDVGEFFTEDIWDEPGAGGITTTWGDWVQDPGGYFPKKILGQTSVGDSGDTEYDETRAAIRGVASQQKKMAQQQWELYKEFFLPYEIEAAKANRELLPIISEASKVTLEQQAPATKEFYRQALEGIDVGERVSEAQADVISATRLGEGKRRREISRYGIDPSSSTFANLANQAALETARNVAGARRAARTKAEEEKFARLGFGLGRGVYQTRVGPSVDPYARAATSYSGAASTYAPLASRVMDDFNKKGSLLGGIAGTGLGAFYGPQEAMAGYSIGSGIGGMV